VNGLSKAMVCRAFDPGLSEIDLQKMEVNSQLALYRGVSEIPEAF